MRQRREIAARADRPATRHARDDAARETLEQQLDGFDPGAGRTLRERVRAQDHGGADDLRRIGIADTARVAPQEPQLQLLRELFRDRPGHEAPEAGVDAVGVLARPVRRALDELARGTHLRPRLVGERGGGGAEGDRPYVVEPEVVSGQADRRRLSHEQSL